MSTPLKLNLQGRGRDVGVVTFCPTTSGTPCSETTHRAVQSTRDEFLQIFAISSKLKPDSHFHKVAEYFLHWTYSWQVKNGCGPSDSQSHPSIEPDFESRTACNCILLFKEMFSIFQNWQFDPCKAWSLPFLQKPTKMRKLQSINI